MRSKCGFGWNWTVGLALALALATASGAAATTLADLQGGESLILPNGLRFENFNTVISGVLDTDPMGDGELGDYEVVILVDGFRIVGPMGAADTNAGDILIEYDVVASAGIIGASLFFNGAAIGLGANASVTEDFILPGAQTPFEDLAVGVTGGGGSIKFDTVSFEPFTSFHVIKDIAVISDGEPVSTNLAVISLVDQRFAVVPEPSSLALVASGLLGLAQAGRKRKRTA